LSALVQCCGSKASHRRLDMSQLVLGERKVIHEHGPCSCNTPCRRVALWHERPLIEAEDNWIQKVIAHVTFGDGCNGPTVEVDWKRGVILDLLGCYTVVALEVVEAIEGPDEDNLFGFGVLSACCGAGGARGCATRTGARVENEGPDVSLINVPPFAYAVAFATATPDLLFDAANLFFQLGSGTGAFPQSVLDAKTGASLPDPWLLVGGVQTIAVQNTLAEAVSFEPVFLIGV